MESINKEYEVFKKGKNKLRVLDWAGNVEIFYEVENGCGSYEFTLKQGAGLAKVINNLSKKDRECIWIDEEKSFRIRIEYTMSKDLFEIIFYEKHNTGVLWLTAKEALKLAKLIQKVIENLKKSKFVSMDLSNLGTKIDRLNQLCRNGLK